MAPRRHFGQVQGLLGFESLEENGGNVTRCCVPTGECLRAQQQQILHNNNDPMLISLDDLRDTVRVSCNNELCINGRFMHRECFEQWEQTVLAYLKTCGRARSWSERQRHQNLWTKKGYDLAYKACACKCGRGHLKKDLDWMPPPPTSNIFGRIEEIDTGKKKKRRNRNSRPLITANNNITSIMESRGRTGSLSSSNRSSSPPASLSEPSISPVHANLIKKSRIELPERIRNTGGANGIFTRRLDFSSFNSLPKVKLNSYQIKVSFASTVASGLCSEQLWYPITMKTILSEAMVVLKLDLQFNADSERPKETVGIEPTSTSMPKAYRVTRSLGYPHICHGTHICPTNTEDEGNHGNDDTRCFILSTLASQGRSKVQCVLCEDYLLVFDRYPLVDGTFFLSPRQHAKSCIEVKVEGRLQFLSCVCMGCLEGVSGKAVSCRFCNTKWDGSSLVLGTMYSYDIFAAMPCCVERIKCNSCYKPVLHPVQRLNFFSDYSHMMPCPHCRTLDTHFVKPLCYCFVQRLIRPLSQRP